MRIWTCKFPGCDFSVKSNSPAALMPHRRSAHPNGTWKTVKPGNGSAESLESLFEEGKNLQAKISANEQKIQATLDRLNLQFKPTA